MEERIEITSTIFTKKPTILFAETMNVRANTWEIMYYKYKWLGYSKRELKEWFELKYNPQKISYKTIDRYVKRQEIYDDVHFAVKKGVRLVNIHFFKRHQQDILNLDNLED